MPLPNWPKGHRCRHNRGITLIELMIALALLSILLTMAVPSFQSTAARNRLITSSSQLQGALALTRTEAIRLGKRVTTCVRAGNACSTAASPVWSNGWITFIDQDQGGTVGTIDNKDTIIRQYDAAATDIVIKGNAPVKAFVSYTASGQAKTSTGSMQIGTIRVCSQSSALADAERAKDLALNASGRIATTTADVTSSCTAP